MPTWAASFLGYITRLFLKTERRKIGKEGGRRDEEERKEEKTL